MLRAANLIPGIIHIHGSWADIVEDFNNLVLFFDAYNKLDNELSPLVRALLPPLSIHGWD